MTLPPVPLRDGGGGGGAFLPGVLAPLRPTEVDEDFLTSGRSPPSSESSSLSSVSSCRGVPLTAYRASPNTSSSAGVGVGGGSGSSAQEISDAVDYGVVKMNVDTDTQYAFTRPVAGWMLENYTGVLKIDGEVGNKKQYDPRAWGKAAEAGMTQRVVEACEHLGSAGKSMAKNA